MLLGSHIAVAVAQASSRSSDSTPSLGTFIVTCGLKERKEREKKKFKSIQFLCVKDTLFSSYIIMAWVSRDMGSRASNAICSNGTNNARIAVKIKCNIMCDNTKHTDWHINR